MRVGNLAGRLSLLVDGGAIDVQRASGGRFSSDPQAAYACWSEFTAWAQSAEADPVPFSVEQLGPPAPRPSQVFALAANYREHAAEGGVEVPDSPAVFTKWASSFTGPVGQIGLPSGRVDWEVELVAVMAHRAYKVAEDDGWQYVAGLTVGQDLSERDVQLRGPYPQMGLGKSFPGFSPTGPYLVTPDEFSDPDSLELGCSINGEVMQNGTTSALVFSVPALIAGLSAVLPLGPGDVIFTGTPPGVGFVRKPQRFLMPGDELVSYVEGIGEMRHTFTTNEGEG